jgi:hypothetical protein
VRAFVDSSAKPLAGGGPGCLDNFALDVIEGSLSAAAAQRVERFLVVDLGVVVRRWHFWRKAGAHTRPLLTQPEPFLTQNTP